MNSRNILRLTTNNKKVLPHFYSVYFYSTKTKVNVVPDEDVINNIDNKVIGLREHPGIFKPRAIVIPDSFVKAITNVVEDQPIPQLLKHAITLNRHLKSKVPPMEQEQINEVTKKAYEKAQAKYKNVQINSESDELRLKQMIQNMVQTILKGKIYNWKPIIYDDFTALVYLMGRSAAEYGVLARVFLEINKRDPEFKPRSFFDFGSGVGTATWAANLYWKQHIFEYFNVDSSATMNDLSLTLLQGGRGNSQLPIKGVFYRQFLPAKNTKYDLVVSAYTLLELPSFETRLNTILNLWNKTEKYLVIVEQGTNAGFKVINEIRDFILHLDKPESKGHVFSPCPHDTICPRYVLDDGTPCNFEVTHFTLPFGGSSEARKETFSYLILKKGERSPSEPQWSRIVRKPLVRSKHTVCRMCTSSGELTEVIFTAAKFGKTVYQCARSTKWGDILPYKIESVSCDENSNKDIK